MKPDSAMDGQLDMNTRQAAKKYVIIHEVQANNRIVDNVVEWSNYCWNDSRILNNKKILVIWVIMFDTHHQYGNISLKGTENWP